MQRPVKIRSARHKLTRTGVRYMYVAHLALDIVHTYSLSLSLSFLLFPQFPPSACLNCIDRRVPPDSSFSFFFLFFFGWRERERRKNGCLNVRKDLPFSLSPLCLNLKFDKKRLDDWDHRRAAIPSVLAQSVIITPPIRNGRKHFITRWREVYAHCTPPRRRRRRMEVELMP